MELTRRKIMVLGSAAVVTTGLGGVPARAAATEDAIVAFTGGAQTAEGGVTLDISRVIENGFTVPIEVAAPGAVAIAVFADANPAPPVATFRFGPLNPSSRAATRIRLSGSQKVIAVAQMQDGSFARTQTEVAVTIGGCGA